MANTCTAPSIDEYLRKQLMPVEGTIPHLEGIEMFAQEIATMLYGELHPYGYFRFVNFGHVSPLVFSAEYQKFMEIDKSRMVQFLPLGLQIPEDHPDRNMYLSLESRKRRVNSSDVAELTLLSPGDIFFLIRTGSMTAATKKNASSLKS